MTTYPISVRNPAPAPGLPAATVTHPADPEIPAGHVKTRDGQVIPRDKACFRLRETEHQGQTYLVARDRAYQRGPGGALRRVGPAKLTKAERKQAKKARRLAREQQPSAPVDQQTCTHRWVSNGGRGGDPDFRLNRQMGSQPIMHVACGLCGARTWFTEDQWQALQVVEG